MLTLRDHGLSRTTTYDERMDSFGTWFDIDVDAATSIIPIVRRLGLNFQRIVGNAQTAKAFAQLHNCRGDWHEAVEETDFYLETQLGDRLSNLSAYAVFGLLIRANPEDEQIRETLETVEDLLIDCPPEHWLPQIDDEPLLPTALMARARWNLDNGMGLAPEGLALLGCVKLTRIRNMMSGSSPELPKDVMGLLSNEAARAWLDNRDCFLPTVSQDEGVAVPAIAATLQPVFVPVARDGSIFTPDLTRNGRYQIGEKGTEEHVSNFDEALAKLQSMPVAKWRRPNESDNWGIVSAVEWRRVDRSSF